MTSNTVRRGVTLIEVVVVLGIIGVLTALTLGAIQRARESSLRAQCLNRMRQIGLALHGYHATHGRLPPVRQVPFPAPDPHAMVSWMALILPEMEQGNLWRAVESACRTGRPPYENPPHVGYATVISEYLCPSDDRLGQPLINVSGIPAAYTDYIGVFGAYKDSFWFPGVFAYEPGLSLNAISDGTTCTVMVGERPPPNTLEAGRWYTAILNGSWGANLGPDIVLAVRGYGIPDEGCPISPAYAPGRLDERCDRTHFWSLHAGGANFLFCDGSVRFLAYSADPILPALASVSGGEPVEPPN